MRGHTQRAVICIKIKSKDSARTKTVSKRAVIAAEHADVVVLCLGLDATVEGEEGDAGNEYASGDKLGPNLPGLQEELLETITAVGKPVVPRSLGRKCHRPVLGRGACTGYS